MSNNAPIGDYSLNQPGYYTIKSYNNCIDNQDSCNITASSDNTEWQMTTSTTTTIPYATTSLPYTAATATYGPIIPTTGSWSSNVISLNAEAMVGVIDGYDMLPIFFGDQSASAKALERLIRLHYKNKDEIGEKVKEAIINKTNAALTLPWLLAYLFSKRSEHEACAEYIEDICRANFIKSNVLTLVGSHGSVWEVFTSYEGDLTQLALEFSAYCQTI